MKIEMPVQVNIPVEEVIEYLKRDGTLVEVVRCKDCKNYDLASNGVNGVCNRQYATFYSWDYCSYGERKGEE